MKKPVSLLLGLLIILHFSLISYSQSIKLQANLGHAGTITHIEFSPDGKTFITSSTDHSLKLWDTKTAREIVTFKGHTSEVVTCTYSPDGSMIVSSDEDHIRIWETYTGKLIKFIEGERSNSIEFVSEKSYMTGTVFLNKFRLNSSETDKPYFFSQEKAMIDGFVNKIAVSPDKKMMAIGSMSNIIDIVRTLTGKRITELKGHSSKEIKALCFSPDNKYLISAGHGPIKMWDTEKFNLIKSFNGHGDFVNDLTFSKDGKLIASASEDGSVKIWKVDEKKFIYSLDAHQSPVKCVAFSPDGRLLISGGEDKKIRIWDVNSGKEIKNIGDKDIMQQVSFGKDDNKILAQSIDMSLKIWETRNTDIYTNFTEHISEDILYGYDREGKFVFTEDYIWSVDSAKIYKEIDDHNPESETFVIFSKDNRRYYLQQTFGIAKIDLQKNELINEIESGIGENVIAVSLEESLILGSEDEEFKSYDPKSGKEKKTFKGHLEDITCLAFNSNGEQIASGAEDKIIKIWDAKGGYELLSLSGHESSLTAVCFHPQKNLLASGSEDNMIMLWDSETGDLIKTFDDHSGAINSLSFSENGSFLISGSDDGSIRIWDIDNMSLLASVYCLKNSDDWVAVTGNGLFDGTPGALESLHIIRGKEVIPLETLYEKYYSPGLISELLARQEIKGPDIKLTDIKAPPTVNINEPIEGEIFKEEKVKINVSWPALGEDIEEVLIYHNNKLEKRMTGLDPESKNKLDLTLSLINGENLIKVIAVNSQRTESVPQEVKVYYDGIEANSDLHMLVIAVNKHKNPDFNLKYAVNDANAVSKKIKEGSEKIFASTSIHFLLDSAATHYNIVDKLKEMESIIKPQDVFIFYFAGHGTMSLDSIQEFYMIPHDITRVFGMGNDLKENGLSGKELKKWSEKIRAKKQLFIIDACHSGAMVDVLSTRGFEKEKAIAQLARSTGTFWLVASETEQYALELNSFGHGLFTYAILQGMEGKADGKSNDKKITVKELSAFTNDFVPEFSEKIRGNPQYPTSFGYGQDFPLILLK